LYINNLLTFQTYELKNYLLNKKKKKFNRNMSSNQFDGTIPESFKNLTNLSKL